MRYNSGDQRPATSDQRPATSDQRPATSDQRPAVLPVDGRFRDWLTVGFQRSVLVVARTVTALTRILDIVSLIQRDQRIQIVFSTDPANNAIFRAGVDELLSSLGAAVLPWSQVTRTRFDLALSASENDRLAELDAPTLLVPHGIGHQKYYPNSRVVAGMNPDRLVRDGRVVPAAIALSHSGQQAQLTALCPPAGANAVVIGDPSLDRLLASQHRAAGYRAALDASGRTLVVLSSTWGPHSLLSRYPRLPERLAAALPVDEYRLVAVLHPGVWSAHSPWQVRAWLARAGELGLHLVSPTDNWQAALCAAHCVISDEGSLALYAAALDKPILLAADTGANTVPGAPLALFAEQAPALSQDEDLAAQIDSAIGAYRPGSWDTAVRLAVERPGESAGVLRSVLYRLLDLDEPTEEANFAPAEVPADARHEVPALVVGVRADRDVLAPQRFPLSRGNIEPTPVDYRHLVADLDLATYRELSAASVLLMTGSAEQFDSAAKEELARWPHAELVAMRVDHATVLVCGRDQMVSVRAAQPPPGFDPKVLASLVFVRRAQGHPLEGGDKLRIGARVIAVTMAAAS